MYYPPGTILKVYSTKKLVWHFGIASFNGTVIDMAPRKGIARRTMWEFSEGCPVEIVPKELGDLPDEEVHRRAMSYIGTSDYSIFNNNCEHFVNKCKRGIARSPQLVQGSLFAVLLGLLAYGIYDSSKRSGN